MTWTAPIDLYCERTAQGFWAEPLNAFSNLALIVAALWAARSARRHGGATTETWSLVVLAGLVGVGSFVFHTFANVWSEYADTIPIWSFVGAMAFVTAKRIVGLHPSPLAMIGLVAAVLGIVLFVAATDPEAAGAAADPLNGSGQYAPALIVLVGFAAFAWIRSLPTWRLLLGATLAFLAALFFRSIDLRVCAAWPLGTHFLWHIMVAVMVGLLLHVMLMTDRHGSQAHA